MASEEVGIFRALTYSTENNSLSDNVAQYFLARSRSIIFRSDMLISILRQEMDSQNFIEKLREICQMTFRHVIKPEFVLHHKLLTPQGVVFFTL